MKNYTAPVAATEQWMGYDELTVLSGTIMSSSRLGEDDLTSQAGSSGPGGGGIVPAINKVTETRGSSFGIGGGFKGIGAGANEGTNETSIVSDFMGGANGNRCGHNVTDNDQFIRQDENP